MESNKIVGVVLAIIIIAMALVAFMVPSGTDKTVATFSYNGHKISQTLITNSSLFGITPEKGNFDSWSNYSSATANSPNSGQINGGIDMVYVSIATLAIGLILAVLWLVFSFVQIDFFEKKFKFLLPLLAGIFFLITIIVYYMGISAIVSGSTPPNSANFSSTSSIGLLLGGYLVVAALVLSFVGTALSFMKKGATA